ncbi:unnamed protein product, partial [Boreogadus saida]
MHMSAHMKKEKQRGEMCWGDCFPGLVAPASPPPQFRNAAAPEQSNTNCKSKSNGAHRTTADAEQKHAPDK